MKHTCLLCLTVVFISCKKENNPPQNPTPTPPVNYNIKWSVYGGFTDTVKYEYYTDGLERKHTLATGQRTETVRSPGKITLTSYNAAGSVLSTTEHFLNANGLTDSMKPVGSPFAYLFEYNSNRECTRIKSKNTLTGAIIDEAFFYYLNGNRIKDSSSSGNKTIFEYYTDKVSTMEDNPNFGRLYSARGNKNCLKKETHTSSSGVVTVSDYSYEFDANGRITRRIVTGTTGSGSVYFGYY